MELLLESSCQCVTWKVQDFFELPSEIGYSLDSPEFRFAGDSYCLRMYPNKSDEDDDEDGTAIELVKLTSTFPERNISCKLGYRSKYKEREVDNYCSIVTDTLLLIARSILQENRDMNVPNGTLTALCSMRLKVPYSAAIPQSEAAKTSNTKEEQEALPGESVFFSSHSWSFKMELSVESPCQNVTWKVPDFFQLLSKTGYSLNSPEFRFAGDRFCLQFYQKGTNRGNTVDTDLQLVRLTSTFPERIILYKVGYDYINKDGYVCETYHYSCALIGDCGLCISGSNLEKCKDAYFSDGTLTVVCSMRLKEQKSAGSPQSEEAGNSETEGKLEGLPKTPDSVSCAVQTETPDSVSCAVQTEVSDSVVDKEIFKNEEVSSLDTKDVTLLSERMEYLLKKGSDYDLTICVQDKEFRAHRSILSARSPVFAMMLSHDTKENSTGTISIEDCDPDSFDEFLLYVYSGRTENLTPSRALQIYYTADKYDFSSLKERSVRILKTSLSITSICDVVLLAAKHREEELLEVATEFFARNIKKIIVTVGWQKFMSQNPVEANELYVKSMEILLPEN